MHTLIQALDPPKTEPDPAADISFPALYDQYALRVYRYLFYRVRNPKEAEDLTAQVFLEVLQGLPHYTPRSPFAAWLFTIARRRVADHYRRLRPTQSLDEQAEFLPSGEDVLAQVIQAENLERLAGLFARLSAAEQELLRLRFSAELTFAELAALLGQREDAVKKSLYRLLARLERQMEVEDHV
ncbi:MAG: sigma-70 family RNA polymerase sigma factor [Anaerolineaceae bacterium]|nr:sigma-70 family RNA polymerase sigma factor [Anaerolineaceae bacterium]